MFTKEQGGTCICKRQQKAKLNKLRKVFTMILSDVWYEDERSDDLGDILSEFRIGMIPDETRDQWVKELLKEVEKWLSLNPKNSGWQ